MHVPERMTVEEARKYLSPKKNKYHNRRTEYNGRMFDSAHEARTAQELDNLRKAALPADRVVDVQYQVPFPIVVNGEKICRYEADFVVTYADDHVQVIDAKGVRTDIFKLKKKLVKACHGIDIIEV